MSAGGGSNARTSACSGSAPGRSVRTAQVRPSRRRRRAGIRPARTTDDLPLPERPTSVTSPVPPTLPTSSPTSSSRPKNSPASSSRNASRPRYGQTASLTRPAPSIGWPRMPASRSWSCAGSSGSRRRSTQVWRRRNPPGGSSTLGSRTGMTGNVGSAACRSRASCTSRCCQVPSPPGPTRTATAPERAIPCSSIGCQGCPAGSRSRSRNVASPASFSRAWRRRTASASARL